MQREIIYDTLEAFLNGLKERNIQKMSFSETSEKRAEEVTPGMLQVVHVDRVELIAYSKSVIYKCVLKNINHDEMFNSLTAHGFEVSRRTRNIT